MRSLYHLHIPKTGGTSFNTAMRKLYPEDKTLMPLFLRERKEALQKSGEWKNFHSFPFEEIFAKHDFVPTHMNFTQYVPKHFFRVCVLRDPFDRVVSQYSDWARLQDSDIENNPAVVQEQKRRARELSLAQMCETAFQDLTQRHFRNGLSKAFLGESTPPQELNDPSLYTNDRIFEEAKKVLDTFDLVLFTDDLHSGMMRLAKGLQIGPESLAIEHLNKNTQKKSPPFAELSIEDRHIIRSHHRADEQLYAYAKNRYANHKPKDD